MSDQTDTQNPGDEDGDGRRAGWVTARLRTEFTCLSGNGTGVIHSISSAGAVVEKAEPMPRVGEEVRLRFSLLVDTLPLEIRAIVSEETGTSFEVEFGGLTPRTRKLLRMAIARALSHDDDTPTLLNIGDKT